MTYTSTEWADERQGTGNFINCVPASGVNICRAATNGTIPATDAEVLALRVATGDTSGGEDLHALQRGILARYGFSTTYSSDWAVLRDGVQARWWFAVVGQYAALPSRLRNPGQADVFHCITVGPRGGNLVQEVDALQKPGVTSRAMTIDELNHFASTGGFAALGIVEYSHAPTHPVVHIPAGPFFVYALTLVNVLGNLNATHASRSLHVTGGTTYDCGPVLDIRGVMGRRRNMVKVTSGKFSGGYIEIRGRIITEEVAS